MFKYFLKKYFCNNQKFSKITVDKNEYVNVRFDRFISNRLNINWNSLQKHFRKNEIFLIRSQNLQKVERIKIKDQHEKLQINDEIFVNKRIIEKKNSTELEDTTRSKHSQSKNLYLDETEKTNLMKIFNHMIALKSKELIIIDKLSNIACQGGTSLKFSIDTMLSLQNESSPSENNLKLIHRLDKNVSGLMMIGNQIETTRILGDYIKNNKIEKSYLALTQNIPLYIKYLLKENKLNVNIAESFKSFFSGFIKSDENCEKFVIELDSGYTFMYDGSFKILKPKMKINFDKEENNYSMYGKFKITNLIFYDKSNRKFKKFTLNEIDNFSYERLNDFNNFFTQVLENFVKKDSNYKVGYDFECYSTIEYELVSGKKHQIRKHLTKCFFSPIFNDEEYMFDKESSPELYTLFLQLENNYSCDSYKINPLLDKFKIGCIKKSILLQSIRILMPKINLTNLSASKKIQLYEDNNNIVVRYEKLPLNFQKLFELAGLNVSLN